MEVISQSHWPREVMKMKALKKTDRKYAKYEKDLDMIISLLTDERESGMTLSKGKGNMPFQAETEEFCSRYMEDI